MAKRKENSRRPQPRHKRKIGPSQFDKRTWSIAPIVRGTIRTGVRRMRTAAARFPEKCWRDNFARICLPASTRGKFGRPFWRWT